MIEELIKSQIKGREVIYYLTTEDDLNNLKQKGVFADIFILLFSTAVGGMISITIAKSISESLTPEVNNILGVLNILFIVAGLIFLTFSIYFFASSYRTISKIKGSGELKSFSAPVTNKPIGFEIIEAKYWTPRVHKDITQKLKEMIKDNRLEVIASNDIDGDPDVGTSKKLTIKYRHNGMDLIKEYNEKEKINLP